MSKQGNYVTLPGGGVNWAEGLSSSLANLSAGYRKQAENEIAAKESAAKLELMKAQEARAAESARFDAIKRQEELDAKQALHALDKLVYSADGIGNQTFTLEDYRPEMRDVISEQLGLIDSISKGTSEYLLGPANGDSTKLVENYSKLLAKTGLDQAEINNRKALFANDLGSLQDERLMQNISPEEWSKRVAGVVADRFDPLKNSIEEGISRGAGMLRSSKLNAIMRNMDPTISKRLLTGDVDKLIGTKLDALSREELLAKEGERVKAANEAEQIQFDRNLERLKLFSRASPNKSIKTADDAIAIMKDLGIEGPSADYIGSWDIKDVREGFNYLISTGKYSPAAIGAVMYSSVEDGPVDNTFPEIGSEAFAKMEAQIAQMDKVVKSGGGNGNFIKELDKSNFKYTPTSPRSLLDIQLGNFGVTGNPNYRLNIDPKFDRQVTKKVLDAEVAAKLALDAKLKGEGKKADNYIRVLPAPSDITSAEDLGKYTLPEISYKRRGMNPYGDGVDMLKAELGDALDVKWGYSKRHRSDREKLSKQLLDAYEDLRKTTSIVRDYNDPIGDKQTRSMAAALAKQQLQKLEDLKAELLTLK